MLLTALCLFVALPASARQLSLEIRDGIVTMSATAVPVRQVLAEWARVGGTRVVGAERVTGPPLTLQLEGVSEAKALDIILRGAAGYVAATRAVPGSGVSLYDRILVLASSTPPAAAPAAANGRPGGRFTATPVDEGLAQADTTDLGSDVSEPAAETMPVNPFAGAFAQPGMTPAFGQQAVPFGQPGQPMPFGQPVPFGQPAGQMPFGTAPGQQLFVPVQQPPDQAAPQGFFGVIGSATPGMVQQPAPQNQQPRQRPPG